MYPRSRKPGAATSNSGGSKRKHVFTTGTRYERKPRSLGMLLRMRTTAGPNPKPTLFTNHSPNTRPASKRRQRGLRVRSRSEEHTSELQSRSDLVCRLLLEKKKQ